MTSPDRADAEWVSAVPVASTDPAVAAARTAQLRRELNETLDAIDDAFNLPKQLAKARESATRSYSSNPAPWILAAGIVAIGVVGLIVRAISRDD